jgi:hypothetical protein
MELLHEEGNVHNELGINKEAYFYKLKTMVANHHYINTVMHPKGPYISSDNETMQHKLQNVTLIKQTG